MKKMNLKQEVKASGMYKDDKLPALLELLGKRYGVAPDALGGYDLNALYDAVAAETGKAAELPAGAVRSEGQPAQAGAEVNSPGIVLPQKKTFAQAQAQQLLSKLLKQEQEAKQLYPKLELRKELGNKDFCDLLRAGVSVRTAFEIVHKDEILPAVMYYTAQQVEQKLANKLLSDARRPGENGSAQCPAVSKSDVSGMTRAERREIIRRVQRGETIRF